MLKVVVVDDEKLVRKGIISAMPWQKYGMEVVGEAQNGRTALEFMARNAVDLLVTDLSMPGLSGVEFIAQVREKFPLVMIIVLTFHQEFEVLQQVLRLGVIDYITKAQIERESADEMLQRLSQRIAKERGTLRIASALGDQLECARVVVLFFRKTYHELGNLADISGVASVVRVDESYVFIITAERCGIKTLEQVARRVAPNTGIVLITVSGADFVTPSSLLSALRRYIGRGLFYEYQNDRVLYKMHLGTDGNPAVLHSEGEPAPVAAQFAGMQWLTDLDEYKRLEQALAGLAPDGDALRRLFYPVFCEWSTYLGRDASDYFDEVAGFESWCEWKDWLDGYRSALRLKVQPGRFSPEVNRGIAEVVSYINQNFVERISLEDVIAKAHISRSHFSECFKSITGKSFGDYLRDLRLEKARKLLEQTEMPIHSVAESCGYFNDKYFSRVFRECIGVQPRDYRNRFRGSGSPIVR